MIEKLSNFKLSREQMGFSKAEAAKKLNVTISAVEGWDTETGLDKSDLRFTPSYHVRLMMSLIANGKDSGPWPE